MCTFTVGLFLGGGLPPLPIFYWIPSVFWCVIKILFFLFTFVWVRTTFPRYRYDQLMRLGWKIFLPLALGFVLYISGILLGFNFLI
jgi:NADH-quinone oxidoreductase subunit H